jgi:hypothetical protein
MQCCWNFLSPIISIIIVGLIKYEVRTFSLQLINVRIQMNRFEFQFIRRFWFITHNYNYTIKHTTQVFFFLHNLHKGHKRARLCRFHNILKHYPNQFRKTFFEPKQYEVQIFKLRMHAWIGRKSTLPYRSHEMSV